MKKTDERWKIEIYNFPEITGKVIKIHLRWDLKFKWFDEFMQSLTGPLNLPRMLGWPTALKGSWAAHCGRICIDKSSQLKTFMLGWNLPGYLTPPSFLISHLPEVKRVMQTSVSAASRHGGAGALLWAPKPASVEELVFVTSLFQSL